MAKTVTLSEEAITPSYGRWYWKEDSNSLEFQSSANPAVDQKDKKGHRKKNIAYTFTDHPSKKDRTPSGRHDVDKGKGVKQGVASKGSKSKAAKETTVTLQRVKSVVLASLNEVNIQTISFEACLFELNQFDEFLWGLLNYFSSFFEQIVLESKPKTMTTEPSQAEKKAMAEIKAYMEAAQRKLARSYCVLILGLGLSDHHHMGCGSDRVSSTYKDREIYEILYRFCVHLVWIVFCRRDYDLINKEMGRMLRSDVFNPALRIKNVPEEEEEFGKEEVIDADYLSKKLLSPAEYRRRTPKRPAITQIINQRSPVLVSLLPTPKEENDYLFERMTLDSTGNKAVASNEEDSGPKIRLSHRVGIIGEPLAQFNPSTLAPLGSEQDEENDEDQAKQSSQFGTATPEHGGLTRQQTDLSQATTEVFSDDDEDEGI